MYSCYWNFKTNKWDVDFDENSRLASQFIYGYKRGAEIIGFHCKEDELGKYTEKMKKREIVEREKEILKLQKEITAIKKIEVPVI